MVSMLLIAPLTFSIENEECPTIEFESLRVSSSKKTVPEMEADVTACDLLPEVGSPTSTHEDESLSSNVSVSSLSWHEADAEGDHALEGVETTLQLIAIGRSGIEDSLDEPCQDLNVEEVLVKTILGCPLLMRDDSHTAVEDGSDRRYTLADFEDEIVVTDVLAVFNINTAEDYVVSGIMPCIPVEYIKDIMLDENNDFFKTAHDIVQEAGLQALQDFKKQQITCRQDIERFFSQKNPAQVAAVGSGKVMGQMHYSKGNDYYTERADNRRFEDGTTALECSIHHYRLAVNYDRRPEYLNALGNAYFYQKNLHLAERTLRMALYLRPSDPRLSHDLANVYTTMECFEQAHKYHCLAIKGDPANAQYLRDYGANLYNSRRYTHARRAFCRAIAIEQNSDDYYRCLGDSCLQIAGILDGSSEKRLRYLEEALTAYMTSTSIMFTEENLSAVGSALVNLQRVDDGIHVRNLIGCLPTDYMVHSLSRLADTVGGQENLSALVSFYEEEILGNPSEESYWESLSVCLFHMGEYERSYHSMATAKGLRTGEIPAHQISNYIQVSARECVREEDQ